MKKRRHRSSRTSRDILRPTKVHNVDWRAAAWRASRPGKRGEQALQVLQDMFMQYYPREFQEKIETAKRWGTRGTVSLRVHMMESKTPIVGLHVGPPGSDDVILWSGARKIESKNLFELETVGLNQWNQRHNREPKAQGYGYKRSSNEPFWEEAEVRAPQDYRFLGWRRIHMGRARGRVSPDRKDMFALWINTRAPRSQIIFAKLAQNELDPRRWPRLRWAKSKIGRNESL